MTIRTKRTSVTFSHPFRLDGIEGVQPPGFYDVDTDEELIDSLSFLAHRRVATTIHVRHEGALQAYAIDPADLEASLLRDAGSTVLPQRE